MTEQTKAVGDVADAVTHAMAAVNEAGGLFALRAACIVMSEVVASEIPEEFREQFMFDLLAAFARGTGGKVHVVDPEVANAATSERIH